LALHAQELHGEDGVGIGLSAVRADSETFAREALGFIGVAAMSARCVLSIKTTSAASAGRVARRAIA